MKINCTENTSWLAKMHLGLGFWNWCKKHDLDPRDPVSLHFYRNEIEERLQNENMEKTYFSPSVDAFFDEIFILRWGEGPEKMEIWNASEKEIDYFLNQVKDSVPEKWKLSQGEFVKII